jgi:hypothetical protein
MSERQSRNVNLKTARRPLRMQFSPLLKTIIAFPPARKPLSGITKSVPAMFPAPLLVGLAVCPHGTQPESGLPIS